MSIIENLSWYNDYNLILEGKRIAEKDIEDLENPEKQLQRVKKFYKNIGADYTKNNWIAQVEEDISTTNKGEDSRLNQLKREVKFGEILENAVQKQDEESTKALLMYRGDEIYAQLINKIRFYIAVSQVKKNHKYIKEAYDRVRKSYPLEKASIFAEEGVFYYIYYFQCLQILIKKHKGRVSYDDVKSQVQDRCYNARLMLNRYSTDIYLADEVQLILSEIEAVESALKDDASNLT